MQAQNNDDEPSGGEQGRVGGGRPGGWDPYEVWRTRVLLPRLKQLEWDARDSARRAPVPNDLHVVSAKLERPIILTGRHVLPR